MARACPVCGSRRWRRDNVTGSAVCEDGHVYQDFRVENQDADGPSQYALQRRKIRTGTRGQKKDKGGANELYYPGSDAEFLRLQALQLLLRFQVQAFRKLWDLPDIFEMVIRDLWTYQLATSTLPPPPEENTPQSRANTPLRHQQPMTALSALDPALQHNARSEGESETEKDDNSGSDKSDPSDSEEQLVDADLLEEMSHLSDLTDREEDHRHGRGRPKGRVKRERKVKASDTLAILLLGMWVVRRSVMCADMEAIVNIGTIPYLDFAHTTLLPVEMKKRMNRNVVLSLSPKRSPSATYLFGTVRRLARVLQADYGIPIPEANLPLVSWRVIGGLGGTPVTHSQVMRLLEMVDINTSIVDATLTTRQRKPWHSRSRRSSLRRRGRSRTDLQDTDNNYGDETHDAGELNFLTLEDKVPYTRTDKNRDVIMPEVVVAAGWLVVMKMAYGLDGLLRRTLDEDEPSIGAPSGQHLEAELQRRFSSGTFNPHALDLEKRDYSSMPEDELDRYLNLAESMLLRDREAPTGSDTGTFPLSTAPLVPPALPPTTSWRHFHSAVPLIPSEPPALVPGTGIPPEPAQQLRSYDAKDTTGTYPASYDICLRSAAALIGVDAVAVAETVQLIERRLEKVRKGRKISMRGKYGKGRPKRDSKSRSRTDLARLRDVEGMSSDESD